MNTFAEFKAWKIAMARRCIARCRQYRAEGRHAMADDALAGAARCRLSIAQS